MYFGITKDQLCRLAYEVAEKNGIRHRFNKEKQAAGNDWFYGFMQRNRSVSLRTPESTSLARVIGFRRTEVMPAGLSARLPIPTPIPQCLRRRRCCYSA